MKGSNLFPLHFDVGFKNVLFVGMILQNAGEKFETLPSANSFCRRIMMKNYLMFDKRMISTRR